MTRLLCILLMLLSCSVASASNAKEDNPYYAMNPQLINLNGEIHKTTGSHSGEINYVRYTQYFLKDGSYVSFYYDSPDWLMPLCKDC